MTPDDVDLLLDVQRRSFARASPGLLAGWPERQALDAAGMADLLGRWRYAVLATARRDNRPHAAPVAFAVARGAFWVATVEGLRLRNLRATPWGSLVVMEGERDEDEEGEAPLHRALTAEGPARLHEGEAFERAFGLVRETWLDRHGDAPTWAAALVELRPERLLSHDAARG